MEVKRVADRRYYWDVFGNSVMTSDDYHTEYQLTKEDFYENGILPDGEYYASAATDYMKGFVRFHVWENPDDCRFVGFRVVNGFPTDFHEIDLDTFKACTRVVKII